MQFEDTTKFQVRTSWRSLEVLRQNFETARASIRIAALQYDQAIEQANAPASAASTSSRGGSSQGLNRIQALSSVLSAQNSLISIFVDYETARLNIYRDMGLMEIDSRGLWCDPFYQRQVPGFEESGAGTGSRPLANAVPPAPADNDPNGPSLLPADPEAEAWPELSDPAPLDPAMPGGPLVPSAPGGPAAPRGPSTPGGPAAPGLLPSANRMVPRAVPAAGTTGRQPVAGASLAVFAETAGKENENLPKKSAKADEMNAVTGNNSAKLTSDANLPGPLAGRAGFEPERPSSRIAPTPDISARLTAASTSRPQEVGPLHVPASQPSTSPFEESPLQLSRRHARQSLAEGANGRRSVIAVGRCG